MAAQWDTGFMVREPSWHRLEKAVLSESPRTWERARQESGLTWEVTTDKVYGRDPGLDQAVMIPGWQAILRNDKDAFGERYLAIQPDSYAVINNAEFGEVINAVIGHAEQEDPVTFEALFSLYGGRQIVALLYFDEPLNLGDIDSSKTYRFLCFVSRHDGNGGLRGIPTNVRVQCANTLNSAEMQDGRNVGFTIRHTSNWDERVAIVALQMQAARGETAKWVEFAMDLASWKFNARQRDTYLKRMFPISDDMGTRMADNRLADREQVRTILESPSVTDLEDTGYKLLMATTEWSDHYRSHASTSSYIGRQLLRKEEPKARSARILRAMAGAK